MNHPPLRTLGLTGEDRHHVLYYLGYTNVPTNVAFPQPQTQTYGDSKS